MFGAFQSFASRFEYSLNTLFDGVAGDPLNVFENPSDVSDDQNLMLTYVFGVLNCSSSFWHGVIIFGASLDIFSVTEQHVLFAS